MLCQNFKIFLGSDKKNIFIMGHSEGGAALQFITDERLKSCLPVVCHQKIREFEKR